MAFDLDTKSQKNVDNTEIHIKKWDDDDDFSGPAIGGPVGIRSDSDDDDEPPTMRNNNRRTDTGNHLAVPANKKPFKMEVVDF